MNKPVAPQIVQRIRAEYLEMPGLSLRPEQVQRLCGVDSTLCESVLEALVESGFLSRRADGAYARDPEPRYFPRASGEGRPRAERWRHARPAAALRAS